MKEFFQRFVAVFILVILFLFIGELFFLNFWTGIAFIAFLISILVTLFIERETRIEELEKRLKALEPENEEKDKAI